MDKASSATSELYYSPKALDVQLLLSALARNAVAGCAK